MRIRSLVWGRGNNLLLTQSLTYQGGILTFFNLLLTYSCRLVDKSTIKSIRTTTLAALVASLKFNFTLRRLLLKLHLDLLSIPLRSILRPDLEIKLLFFIA